jgi:hypothetical protein
MGTSSSQRSPATPEWERVRELYRQPNPEPGAVVSRVVQALDPVTRQAMSDVGVAICLDTVLVSAKQVATSGLETVLGAAGATAAVPPPLSYASVLRSTAQERIIHSSTASRFAELAIDGLAVTAMEMASGGRPALLSAVTLPQADHFISSFVRGGRLHQLSGKFLGNDLDRAFRYFVGRDLSDFVGTEAFPTVGHAKQLLDSVAAYCRRTSDWLPLDPYEPLLQEAVASPETVRIPMVHSFLRQTMAQALDLLSSGGVV